MEDNVETPEVENEEILQRLVDTFEDFETTTATSRKETELDRDYYDGKQWTEDEIRALQARKQPVITINRIKPKIDFLLGMERQNRTDPKAYPRTPQHDQAANAASDALRYIADNNDFDQLSSECFESLLIEGTEAAEIYAEKKGDSIEIGIASYQWDRIWWDIHSRKRDFSDAKVKGITLWMDLNDAKEKWKGKDEILESAFESSQSIDDTYEDTPRTLWSSKAGKRERIRINMACFKEEGVWFYAYYVKNGFLTDPKPHPYKDEHGDPECPLEFQSAYVDRDGFRYGVVRPLRDIQDEINKRRSKSLHLLNSRNVIMENGAVQDIYKAKQELAKPDGIVEVNPQFRFELQNMSDLTAGQFQLMQESKNEIDSVGANPLQGKTETGSGRAFMAKQQAGQMELGPVFDSHRAFKRRIYRQIWNRVRQYWTEQRWVRITDDERNIRFVGLNKPITMADQIKEQFGEIPKQFINDPRLNQQIGMENPIAEMDMDIIIEESPDVINIQQEQFEELARLAQVYGPQEVPFEEIVRFSQLRGKDEYLKRVKGDEQQKAANAQKQQEVEEMQKIAINADIQDKMAAAEKKRASALRDIAETEKTRVETQFVPQDDQYYQ